MKKTTTLFLSLAFTFVSINYSKASPDGFSKNVISVGMVVSDLEKSIDFYTNIIGMSKVGSFSVPGSKSTELGLTNGKDINVTVLKLEDSENATEWKLMTFGEKAKHPKQNHINNDTGIQYVTIFVNSVGPFLKRCKQNNVKILSGEPSPLGNGRFFLLVQDPDGTFVELIGGK